MHKREIHKISICKTHKTTQHIKSKNWRAKSQLKNTVQEKRERGKKEKKTKQTKKQKQKQRTTRRKQRKREKEEKKKDERAGEKESVKV